MKKHWLKKNRVPLLFAVILLAMVVLCVCFIVRDSQRTALLSESKAGALAAKIAAQRTASTTGGWLNKQEQMDQELQGPWMLVIGKDQIGGGEPGQTFLSEGDWTAEGLARVRTIVWAEPGQRSRNYQVYHNGAAGAVVTGTSQYYTFYCIDTATGAVYKGPNHDTIVMGRL